MRVESDSDEGRLFSSRRRHTRSLCDWSSDVCSSDLAKEHVAPDWLVFGAAIRTVSMSGEDSGLHPLGTALEDEGFGDVSSEHLVAGFARHLMVAIDRWQETGFVAIAKEYISKLEPESGARHDIDETGDLCRRRVG